jgi:hypothetical protein
MKTFIAPVVVAVVFTVLLSSCKKTDHPSLQAPVADFTGHWSLVNDSTVFQFWGLWSGTPTSSTNYTGNTGDYYNILQDGTVYTAENSKLDTFKLTVTNNDTLVLKYLHPGFLNPVKYLVSNHTDHTLTLNSAVPLISPQTVTTHFLNFKK